MSLNIIKRASELDILAKVVIVMLSFVFVYIAIICIILPFSLDPSKILTEEYVLSFDTPEHKHYNLLSLFGALLGGCVVSILLRKKEEKEKADARIEMIKEVLSSSEKEIVKILQETKEITQDSLMFRLNWSKSKVSTIITNMEKRNIIQRKREGKTYTIFLPKK